MTNEELVQAIQNKENPQDNIMRLYEQNKGLIYKIATPFFPYSEPDDLMQEAFIGFMQAIDHYQPDKGMKFSSYCTYCIKTALRRCCFRQDEQNYPEYVLVSAPKYVKYRELFCAEYKREPTKIEFCKELQVNIKELKKIEEYLSSKKCSMNQNISDDNSVLEDTISSAFNLEDEIIAKESFKEGKAMLWEQVQCLPDKCPDIIECIFKGNKNMAETAEFLKIPLNKVRTLKNRSLQLLAWNEKVKESANLIGYDWGMSFFGGWRFFKEKGLSSVEYIVENHDARESRLPTK